LPRRGDRVTIQVFAIVAVLVEALTGVTKAVLTSLGLKLQDWADQAISLVFAMAMAFMGRIDFFALVSQAIHVDLGFPAFFGMFLSGLIMSRGSNAVHDILKKLNPQQEMMRIW